MSTVLALDVGGKRIGAAIAEAPVYLAHPLVTLDVTDSVSGEIIKLIEDREVQTLVVGLPRNQSGEATAQTDAVKQFIDNMKLPNGVKLVWQDESLTSVKAEEELEKRKKPYSKADIDALAATLILEDYLKEKHD